MLRIKPIARMGGRATSAVDIGASQSRKHFSLLFSPATFFAGMLGHVAKWARMPGRPKRIEGYPRFT